MRFDRLNLLTSKFFKHFKMRNEINETVTVSPQIVPTLQIDRPFIEWSSGQSVSGAGTATFNINKPGQRFVITGVCITGFALVTNGLVGVYGSTDETSTCYLGGQFYTVVGADALNISVTFLSPIVLRENSDLTLNVVAAGAGSSHLATVTGYYI